MPTWRDIDDLKIKWPDDFIELADFSISPDRISIVAAQQPAESKSKMVSCKYCRKRLTSECPRMNTEWGGQWASNDESKFDDWYCDDAERVEE